MLSRVMLRYPVLYGAIPCVILVTHLCRLHTHTHTRTHTHTERERERETDRQKAVDESLCLVKTIVNSLNKFSQRAAQ